MKYILVFMGLVTLSLNADAQRIEDASHNLIASVDYATQSFLNTSDATICKFMQDGRIIDGHSNTIGYIIDDHELQDGDRNTVGYFNHDGTIEDAHHAPLGSIVYGTTATVKNSAGTVIGYAKKAEPTWAAAYFFVLAR